MAGVLLLGGMQNGIPVSVPENPSLDLRVAPNFERFDGLSQPALDHPAGVTDGTSLGFSYGDEVARPGGLNQPEGQTYTPSPVTGVVGTLGGQPYPAFAYQDNSRHGFTPAIAPTVQYRLGVGQYGPSALGAAQTLQLAGITNNPPEPGDLSMIVSGLG